jgi:hypothetical protein
VIAQYVHNAPECGVRFPAITPIQFQHQFLEPGVGPLNSGIQDLKTGELHVKMQSTWRAVHVRTTPLRAN